MGILLASSLAMTGLSAQDVSVVYLDGSVFTSARSDIDRIVIGTGEIRVVPNAGEATVHEIAKIARIDLQGMNNVVDMENDRLKVWPTVADAVVHVEGVCSGEEVRLYDFKGAVVLSFVSEDGSNDLDVSGLPQGMYILRTGQMAKKIIKR